MRILLVQLILVLFPVAIFAQKPPVKFGKIDKDELKMTRYDADPQAEALVLCDFGSLEFEFASGERSFRFFRTKRIKIFKESGYQYADILIPFYSDQGLQKIIGLKATTHLPDGREVDVKKKDIFEEKVNEYWSRIRFTFPALEPGAIVEYKYEMVSRLTFQLPEWYFQDEIPVKHSELWLEIPEWYNYIFIAQGKVPRPTVEYSYSDVLVGSADRGKVKVTRNTYLMQNVPALRPQPFITTMDDYLSRVRFQLKEVMFPGYRTERVLTDWQNLAEKLWSMDDFGGRINREGSFSDLWQAVQPALAKAGSTKEKVQAVYNFINKNFELNPNKIGVFADERFDQKLKTGKAARHELNMMMVALLRKAGVEAHPVLISTRSHGKPIQIYPLLDQFDHVLCLVSDADGAYFLEAGDPLRPPGLLSENSLNGQGWAVIDGNPQWVDLPRGESSSTVFMAMSLTAQGDLEGSISCSFKGYQALKYRKALHAGEQPLHEKIKQTFPEATIDSIVYTDQELVNKPLKAKVYCRVAEAGMAAGNFLYLSPATLSDFNENPFKTEERLFPVDIPYPMSEKIIANIDLPEGYEVKELPESIKMSLEGQGGSLQYRLSQRGNRLQLISEVKITTLQFEPEQYAALRNFFNLIAEKMTAQVVLSKI